KRGGKVSCDAEKKDKRTASLLPFVALEKLFRNAPPEQAQELRDRAFQLGIVDVVLTCLSHIGRQEARYAKLRSDGNAGSLPSLEALSSYFELAHKGNDNAKAGYALKSHQDGKNETGHGWNRGVGYGSGSTTSKWSIEESKVENAAMEEVVTCLIRVLAAFFNPVPLSKMDPSKANPLEFKPELMRLLYRSCFQRALHAFLLNDSVFEISKHVPLYDAVLEVEAAVASIDSVVEHPSILDDKFARRISEIDLVALMLREKDCGTEPLRQLEKLKRVISDYLGHLVKEPAKKHAKSSDSSGLEDEGAEDEKQLDGLLKKCEKAMQLTKKKLEDYFEEETFDFDDVVEKDPEEAVKIKEENIPSDMLLVQVTPQYYCDAMKSVQFSSIPFFQSDSKTSLFPYHYVSSLPSSGSTADVKRMRRLAQEVTTLKTSLPLSDNSCVFVTTSEERMDVMKFLISGPTGTPYENGCFEFDVMFPPDYPNAPMKVNLATTGNGSVRFNPNLYNCGKVCLSLLGTWDGRPEESWSENSSFLQVLVSIQSLILVPDPYFNEPGYHGQRFSLEGKRASFDYNANIRVETVRWAMTDTLRNPPPAFENVIRRHFWLKSDEICEQVEQWIIELQEKGHENYLHRLK
ncbi:Ubiquitin-conjugating enzyme family protein, partial [Aphelenchoides avenae]